MRGALLVTWMACLACAHAPVEQPVQPVPAAPVEPPANPQAVEAQAQAAFEALEPGFQGQLEIKLDEPQRLKAGLTLKSQGVTRLEREYQAVIKLGAPAWTVAALVRLGMLYDDLAQSLRSAAAPAGLTPEQLDIFERQLNNHADPLQLKAAESFKRAIALEGAALPPSDWVRYARARLEQFDAVR